MVGFYIIFIYYFLSLKKKEREFSRFDKSVVVETELEIHRYDCSLLLYDSSIISKLSDYQETINETTIAIYRRLIIIIGKIRMDNFPSDYNDY